MHRDVTLFRHSTLLCLQHSEQVIAGTTFNTLPDVREGILRFGMGVLEVSRMFSKPVLLPFDAATRSSVVPMPYCRGVGQGEKKTSGFDSSCPSKECSLKTIARPLVENMDLICAFTPHSVHSL